MITSAIDGRIRFRSPALRDQGQAERLQELLDSLEGVSLVSANPRTGSLLVEYLPSVLDQQTVIDAVGLPKVEVATRQRADRQSSSRQRYMRIAKRGMLASMAALLLFAVSDRERAHVAAGLAFLAFNAYHQYTYRRRLLV